MAEIWPFASVYNGVYKQCQSFVQGLAAPHMVIWWQCDQVATLLLCVVVDVGCEGEGTARRQVRMLQRCWMWGGGHRRQLKSQRLHRTALLSMRTFTFKITCSWLISLWMLEQACQFVMSSVPDRTSCFIFLSACKIVAFILQDNKLKDSLIRWSVMIRLFASCY